MSIQKDYRTLQELVALAGDGPISEAVVQCAAVQEQLGREALRARMLERLQVMRASIESGMNPDLRSRSGRVGGQASRMARAVQAGKTFSGSLMGGLMTRALAVSECNACMGKIVAAPTAGACGILPAVLFTEQEAHGAQEEALVSALFTAAGVGRIIAERASISGAQAGCQAECGTAAAMAAAALVELRGGDALACASAVGFALMNMMGLVCDPVDGLVEVPCLYRNVSGAVNAVAAADLALSGIRCPVDVDDLIETMGVVGRQMPESLRETGLGGCASCRACDGAQDNQGAD